MKISYSLSALALVATLVFSGCVEKGYNQTHVGQVKMIQVGHVVGVRNIKINDDGGGSILGGIAGGALGSQMGRGDGKIAATIGGAVLGALAGSALNEDAGQELTIQLDNGDTIVTVYKVSKNNPYMYRRGDPVRVELLNGQITSVTPR